MNKKLMFSSKSDLWCTPQDLFDSLNKEFNFTFDLCATKKSAKCEKYYTPEQDALVQNPISESIWCNPPYSREVGKWVRKCYEIRLCADVNIVVMLLPARTDTTWFHDYILGKSEVRFIKGRLKFLNKEDSEKFGNTEKSSPAPFPSMLVIFGNQPNIFSANKLGKIIPN